MGINVLSLFDGISCGQIALERIEIKVDKYFASEIKEDAIKVTTDNHPNTIQLGDVCKIKSEYLPKIDLLIGGSPCQDLSIAMKNREGLKGSKSKLFFEYVRLLKELKPRYFLLENVARMSKEDKDIITEILGVEPIRINSKLVSAQLRDRLYWTNLPGVTIPRDKGILLKDILESGFTDREKARAILESESRPLRDVNKMYRRYSKTGFTTIVYENRKLSDYAKSQIKNRLDGRKGIGFNYYNSSIRNEKSGTLLANSHGWTGKGTTIIIKEGDIRYFTQTELERLQTLPEGYTRCLNRNKAAGVIGDGWTVDVIVHLLKGLSSSISKENEQ